MFHIILFQPEIPPNTGNIIRLAANTGCQLHIIRPMAFSLDDKRLRRAGLDYHEWARVQQHDSLEACCQSAGIERLFALTTRAQTCYSDTCFAPGDALLFGPETRGLPAAMLSGLPEAAKLRIPMGPNSRSMNLSNAVAVVVFEAWRQTGFQGGV